MGDKTTRAAARLVITLTRLRTADGRIARRNARRRVFGAMRALTHAIDVAYPAVTKPPKARPSKVDKAIKSWTWRQVEYHIVKPGTRRWDREKATAFNAWFCTQEGLTAKPIRFDIPDRSRYLGRHDHDAIRIKGIRFNAKGRDAQLWRTFLHEMSHYNVHTHGPAFRAEIIRVWQLWLTWMKNELVCGKVADDSRASAPQETPK